MPLPGIALQLVLIPAVMVLLDPDEAGALYKAGSACRQAGWSRLSGGFSAAVFNIPIKSKNWHCKICGASFA